MARVEAARAWEPLYDQSGLNEAVAVPSVSASTVP